MHQTKNTAWLYVACYLLWVVTAVLGFLDLLAARVWLHQGYVLLGLSPWGFAAARNFGLIIIAMAWIGGVLYAESYYRDSVAKQRLWKRFAVITTVQAVPLMLTSILALYQHLLS